MSELFLFENLWFNPFFFSNFGVSLEKECKFL